MDWRPLPGTGQARVEGGRLLLELNQEGTVGVTSSRIPVTPDARMHLAFAYTSENLAPGVFHYSSDHRRRTARLVAGLRWLNEKGTDIDEDRALLGFPPLAREWQFHANSDKPRRVADNLSAPSRANAAEISFRIETAAEAGDKDRGTVIKAAISSVVLRAGQITPEGLEFNSGTTDAGPLSTPPQGHTFAANLVPNPTFEEGQDRPTGWKIEGDNRNASAVWQEGGAFSGRRCLKVSDRGPYVRSWGEGKPFVYVPGGSPGVNYAFAREEVSARWVSEPSPAQPGGIYQAQAFMWFANRHRQDMGYPNPVRIQFLDAAGKVLPYPHVWADWLPNEKPFEQEGWVRVVSGAVVAPANTVSVRVAAAMNHAFYPISGGVQAKWAHNRGFVLVDNVSLFRVQTQRAPREWLPTYDAEEVFHDTAQAGGLPFVPTSIAHRPDTLTIESDTGYGGGIVFAPADPGSKPVNLRLQNWIGDTRDLEIRCEVEDWLGRPILKKTMSATVPPNGTNMARVAYPKDLPLGAYTVSYVIREGGVDQDKGFTRFAVLAERETTPEERARMDYPFSFWDPHLPAGTSAEIPMGQMMLAGGMGKSWYALGDLGNQLERLVRIKDPGDRRREVVLAIDKARQLIAVYQRYGVTPMGALHFKMSEEERPRLTPVLAEVITQVVSGLKSDIRHWKWGNEFVGEWVNELDRATRDDGTYYLLWNHPGTVRQYFQTFLVAYRAAKAADPDCMFGQNCASHVKGDIVRMFLQVAKPDEIDGWGINTYIPYKAIWPATMSELRKAGKQDIPLWASEFTGWEQRFPDAGFPSGRGLNSGPDRLRDEQGITRNTVIYVTQVLTDYPTFFNLSYNWLRWNENSRESLIHNRRVRPHFMAYAAMSDILGAGRFVERIEQPGAVIHVRKRSFRSGLVGVMWSTGPEAVVKLNVGSESVEVADVMGNRRRVATPGGVATIPVTPMPQYLLGASVVRPVAVEHRE
jgi:hypothetical protein